MPPLTSTLLPRLTHLIIGATVVAGLVACSEHESVLLQPKAPHATAQLSTPKIKLIYDGDLGPDPCDFTTLSMLHEYHRQGMIDLIGILSASPDLEQANTLALYNRLYGNEITVGAWRRLDMLAHYNFVDWLFYRYSVWYISHQNPNAFIRSRYHFDTPLSIEQIADPVQTYRRLLAGAEDDSITIYAAGPLFNLAFLLGTEADAHSHLSGAQLLRSKVKRLVIMGGNFPRSAGNPMFEGLLGAEYNWWAFAHESLTRDTVEALTELSLPITFVGFEVGEQLPIGNGLSKVLGEDHPTISAFLSYRKTGDGHSKQLVAQNPAFDEVALFHLVEGGLGEYFSRTPGRVIIDKHGANDWNPTASGHEYISLVPGVEDELSALIIRRIAGQPD